MGRTDLDFQLKRATDRGNTAFVEGIASLRERLFRAAISGDWETYDEVRQKLNAEGAQIPYRPYEKLTTTQEQLTMGMFDKPQYLTGKNGEGFVESGDTFWLHAAKLDGQVNISGEMRDQAKLRVSHERDGEKVDVHTAGKGVVNQVKRMDAGDRASFPIELRLDQIPSGKGNPTNVLTPADQDPPTAAASVSDANGDDF